MFVRLRGDFPGHIAEQLSPALPQFHELSLTNLWQVSGETRLPWPFGVQLFWKSNFSGTWLLNFFGSQTFLELAFGTFLEVKLFWNFSGTCLLNFFGSQTFLELFWNLPFELFWKSNFSGTCLLNFFGSRTFLELAFGTFLEPSLFWNLPLELFLPNFGPKNVLPKHQFGTRSPLQHYHIWTPRRIYNIHVLPEERLL